MKFRLREKFTSEIFYRRKYPDLRYLRKSVVKCYKCVLPSQSWRELEAQLFERNVAIPVYFAIEDSELEEIRTNLIMAAKKEKTATAVEGER